MRSKQPGLQPPPSASAGRGAGWLLRVLFIGLSVVLLLTGLLLGGAYLYARGDSGLKRLADLLEELASEPGVFFLDIERATGDPLGRLRLEGITLSDGTGSWLTLGAAEVDWDPTALWQGKLKVGRLHLSQAELLRLPAAGPSDGPDPESGGLPDLPFDLAVKDIAIDSLALAPAVLGSAVLLSSEAALDYGTDGRLKANLLVDLLNEVPGRVSLSLTYDISEDLFDASLEAFEAAGGLTAGLLGLPDLPSLDVNLQGAGSLSDWTGSLVAHAGPGADLEAEIALSGPAPWRLQAKGQSDPARFVADELRPLIGSGLNFDFAAEVTPEGSVTIDRGAVRSDAVALTIAGRGESNGEDLDLRGRAEILNPAAAAALLAPLSFAGAQIDYGVSGSLSAPSVALEADVEAIILSDFRAERLRMTMTAAPDAAAPGTGVRVKGEGTLEGLDTGDSALALLLDESLAFEMSGALGLEDRTFEIQGLEARQSDFAATLTGAGGLVPFTAAVSAVFRHRDLARLAPLIGFSLQGSMSGKANIDLDPAGAARVEASAGFQGFATGIAELDAFAGPAPLVKAAFSLPSHGGVKLQSLTVQGEAAGLSAAGTLDGDREQLAVGYKVALPSLGPLSASLGRALGGAAKLQGRLAGPLASPGLTLQAEIVALSFDDLSIPSLSVQARLDGLAGAPKGRLGLVAASPFGQVKVDSDFAMEDQGRIAFSDLTVLREGRDSATGQLSYLPEAGGLAGDLDLGIADLADWSGVTGTDAVGPLTGRLELSPQDGKQSLRATLSGDAVSLAGPGSEVGRVDLRAELSDLFGQATGAVTLEAAAVGLPGGRLAEARMKASGSLDAAELSLSAKGTLAEDFALDAAAQIEQDEAGLSAILPKIEAAYGALRASSTKALHFQRTGERLTLRDLAFAVGGGTLEGDVTFSEEALEARLAVVDFPLGFLEGLGVVPGLQGTLAGKATLSGDPRSPSGDFSLETANLRAGRDALADLPDLTLRMAGKLAGGNLEVRGELGGFGDQGASLTAQVPVALSLTPLAVNIPDNKPIDARLVWSGRAEDLVAAAGFDRIALAGDAALDLKVQGSGRAPSVSGSVGLSSARYENFTTGTILQALTVKATALDDRLNIQLSGQDEGGGKLTAAGSVLLRDTAAPQIDLAATLENFRAVTRDDVTANISGGLSYAGTLERARVTGRLVSDVIEVRLIDALPPSVVDLKVVDPANPDSLEVGQRADDDVASLDDPIDLDVIFTMPRRVFLRGRGLDSEWAGEVRVSGPSGAPRVAGQLSPVRGTFSFVGKRFQLGEGRVSLEPGPDIDPALDLSAHHEGSEIATKVHVGGRVSAPKITFSSEPPLPEEEVFSRLLFNRSSSQLSPAEALQLAGAAASLSGSGELGVLDIARNSLGVDVLTLAPGGEGELGRLRAGKYLSDNVFVGVEQGTAVGSTAATVEVEVTPNVSVETDVGADRSGSAKVRFKWDY